MHDLMARASPLAFALTFLAFLGAHPAVAQAPPPAAQQCYIQSEPSFCFPWPLQDASTQLTYASVTADSTCGGQNDQRFQAVRGSSVCRTTDPFSVSFLRQGPDTIHNRWQSAVLPSTTTSVTISVAFTRPVFLVSFELRFGFTAPVRMLLERSVDFGTTWQSGPQFSASCASEVVTPCLAISSQSREARYTFSTGVQLWSSATNATTQRNLKARVGATNFRIVFQRVGLPPGETNNFFFYYSATSLRLYVVCDCNGHASACAADSGNCSCQHRTEGRECEKCSSGWTDWRAGSKSDPAECKGEKFGEGEIEKLRE